MVQTKHFYFKYKYQQKLFLKVFKISTFRQNNINYQFNIQILNRYYTFIKCIDEFIICYKYQY